MNTTIYDKKLVKWLIAQGADLETPYSFVLEKGMGEFIQVTIKGKDTVQLQWVKR